MSKKNKILAMIVAIVVIITGIAIATPMVINFVKDNTIKLIDYAADSFKDEKDYSQEVERQSDESRQNKINDGFSDNILKLQIGQNEISINTSYDSEIYELENMYTDVPLDIKVKDSTANIVDDINMTIDGQDMNENNTLEVEALDKDKYIKIKLEYDTYNRTYYVQTLPTDFPEFEKHGVSEYEGDYYSNFYLEGDPYIYKMSNEGDILYYNRAEGEDRNGVTNFAKWNIDDKERYSYFSKSNHGYIDIPGYNYGSFIIMDEDYEEVDNVSTIPSEKYDIYTDKAETHDFIMLDDGHYMLMNYVVDTPNPDDINGDVDMDSKVLAAYIQEIKDDEIVWEWISTDYPEFYKNSVENNDYTNSERYAADYMHINSMFIDPKDSNLIMSFRNQDTVVKVDRETNEILWRFGGAADDFNLSNDQKPSRQHHATITEAGNLLIFDNGTENKQTRIIEANIDEENMELKNYEEFKIDDVFSTFTGSVQKVDEENDVFLIGWGLQRENQHALMSEIDFKNNKVLTEAIEADIENDSYRFMKFK